MERFNFKSGHAVWVVKLIKENWPILVKSFISTVQEYKAGVNKKLHFCMRCYGMGPLVMSLC